MEKAYAKRATVAQVIKTEDGATLAGLIYPPHGQPRAALLISGATGVAQGHYRAFAEHGAARHGLVVMT